MEKNPKIFLEHIIESIDLIEDFILNLTFDEFLHSVEK